MSSARQSLRILAAGLVIVFAAGVISAEEPEHRGLASIVTMIEAHEGKSDPKCHATATRLESFIYGTPLTEEARIRKVDLQKALILEIWKKASTEAAHNGLDTIPADILTPLVEEALRMKMEEGGDVVLWPASERASRLSERDIRQYSSVAYALRAILSVQQDALLAHDLRLLPMSSEAIAAMKRLVDLATLGALGFADGFARDEDMLLIDEALFDRGWARVFPSLGGPVATVELDPARVQPGQLLDSIIEQKVASYSQYNQVASRLALSNVKSYYARHELPQKVEEIRELTGIFTRLMMNFTGQFITLSEQEALKNDSAVVREAHVAEVFRQSAPFIVDEFEDITYFHHLPREKRILIEAYDADSFRDSGVHWLLIRHALEMPNVDLKTDFDPFAAELLAEGTAQMGVLLYRMAGLAAKARGDQVLTPESLVEGARELVKRMAEQLETPPPPAEITALASAPSSTRLEQGGMFREISSQAGIDYLHRSSDWLKRFERSFLYSLHGAEDAPKPGTHGTTSLDHPPTYAGSGVAADDLDGDGDVDILIVGGLGNRLYSNNGDGTFEDLSGKVHLTLEVDGRPGEARQPIITDLDNDGLRDIVITYVDATHRVYRNLGDFQFEDVSERAGLGGRGLVGSSVTAFDYDRDGLLDLYVAYYGNYLEGEGPNLARINEGTTPNRLYRNLGGFRFEDVTAGSGIDNTGWSQVATGIDFDRDGWQDLIVGNEMGVNAYYRNLGDGTFVDLAEELGTRRPSNSMNIGTADLNRDGFPDVYISNILIMVKDEKYVNPSADTRMRLNPEKMATMRIVDANHLFTSVSEDSLLARYAFNESIDRGHIATGWAWDADFADFDNDGDDDVYCVNGLNEYNIYRTTIEKTLDDGTERTVEFSVHQKEPNVLFLNEAGKLRNRSEGSGADLLVNSRAAAYLDFDGDGDLDIVVNNYQEKASFLENLSERLGNNWIKVSLVGDPEAGTNRDAVGATIVAVTPSGNRIWRAVLASTGYLSDHPKEQHIGLGSEEVVDLIVEWPNGQSTVHEGLMANQLHVIGQKDAAPAETLEHERLPHEETR